MYKFIPREQLRDMRHKINILIGTIERGGGPKSRVMRNGNLRYNQGGDILVQELIDKGLLDYEQLRGDRNWVKINKKGVEAVKQWRALEKLFT